MQRELTNKEKFLQGLSSAVHRFRFVLLGILGAITVFVITWFIVAAVQENRLESSTVLAELAQDKFDAWFAEEDEELSKGLAEELFADIDRIIDLYPKLYAAQRAEFIRGRYFFEIEQWEAAAESFERMANTFPKSYLAPPALVNAAVAYEETDDFQRAKGMYNRVLSEYPERSSEIPHILFSLGRLSESADTKENALSFYNRIVDEFPTSGWTNLARDRIIYLNID
ncbi:MAG: hypothetical protein CMN78_06305 [Spirochaetales bacterium]|nr:hypothetical protein [Spirochaetales bacterium]